MKEHIYTEIALLKQDIEKKEEEYRELESSLRQKEYESGEAARNLEQIEMELEQKKQAKLSEMMDRKFRIELESDTARKKLDSINQQLSDCKTNIGHISSQLQHTREVYYRGLERLQSAYRPDFCQLVRF